MYYSNFDAMLKLTRRKKSREGDLNPRPSDYETALFFFLKMYLFIKNIITVAVYKYI